MSDMLSFEDGIVSLGGDILPGLLVQQTVRDAVRYDESKHDSMSGKAKVALGWEDATVSLVLDLLTDDDGDCYDKLAAINRIFKASAKRKATPNIYTVTGRHVRARGISRVVFDALDSSEDDQSDVLQVTLTFVEHLPAVVKREKQATARKTTAKGTTTKRAATAPAVKTKPAASPAIVKDDDPVTAGFKAGSK